MVQEIKETVKLADASDLGWEPSRWPGVHVLDGMRYDFVGHVRDVEGDIQMGVYVNRSGGLMKVFND